MRIGRWLAGAAALGLLSLFLRAPVRGLSFVVRAADIHGAARSAADWEAAATHEELRTIDTGRGPLRVREYAPAHPARSVLLTSGLHPAGIDEPRLVGLARDLAASGLEVVTPDIPELSQFTITPAITDTIEAAGVWLADHEAAGADHRIGLMGISFSGGLSIVAAGRPPLRNRVAYVFAFGGHDDLPRVLRFLCTGVDGEERLRPHDYGVAVILLGVADRIVPADQAPALTAAVRRFLWASHLDRVDKPKADQEYAALRAEATTMPQPSATLLDDVNERNVADLGPRLLPYIGFYGNAPALSPARSPKPTAPVFLLHGTGDNVIPAVESEDLAADLRGHAPTRLLLSGLISHAEADQPVHVGDVVQLATFWGDMLSR